METLKMINAVAIRRSEDGQEFNTLLETAEQVSRFNKSKYRYFDTIDLFFSIYEPFDENGIPNIECPMMHDSVLAKECIFFKN